MELLLAPQNWPFSLALALSMALCLLQFVAGIGGLDLDGDGDLDLDFDGETENGLLNGFLDWLHVGKLPFALSLMLFGLCFGLSGLAVQQVVRQYNTSYLPLPIALPLALLASLPLLRIGGLILRRVLPHDETEAVSAASFLGLDAQVTSGLARRGKPAEARVRDRWGKAHYVLVEPDKDGEEFRPGSHVLLLTQNGPVFRGADNSIAQRALEELEK